MLTPATLNAIATFGQAGYPVDLSIDGQHLVAVGAPKHPDELEAYLEALAPVVAGHRRGRPRRVRGHPAPARASASTAARTGSTSVGTTA